mgnify:CR=1 FL=1
MQTSDLLTKIHYYLDEIPEYTAEIEMVKKTRNMTPSDPLHYLWDYNYATYNEIKTCDRIDPDFKIDSKIVEKFEHDLELYLDMYAPGKKDLKSYISAISLYLTFIAKKPLHPPDVPFSEDFHIVKKGEFYYCSGKGRFIRDPGSLCRYCICKPLQD